MTWSRKARELPPQELLLEIFTYNPETGEFRWRIRPSRGVLAGQLITNTDSAGHIQVMYKKRLMLVHRIIWKMVTGLDPVVTIDHRNTVPNDNRWDNLREATHSQQIMNTNNHRDTVLPKGVCQRSGRNKYSAAIVVNNKQIRLGSFDTAEDAHTAYKDAAIKHYGEFARW